MVTPEADTLTPPPVQEPVGPHPHPHHPLSSSRRRPSAYPEDTYAAALRHPAAQNYFQGHPRRQKVFFGPFLLLNTLGEGEFGKVKLGIHGEWGEEVAVKLIRRNSVSDPLRLGKVEREIEVLRSVTHPNIVRLYDVIETEKYIGIVLEYASGGELFDFILRHKYLKERDACRLFAQLISGVWYLHQKKVIHRDLKLENLLLDRGRNVIITDFGFANRFEHRRDDLMATSCGSPCYAAPELVISEGLYVGSAVDIWSCGVILYAMLAGYLPFDDDPQNPEGDNINLLYKYIVSTPLTFPDFVSPDARDLLSKMLVPDPARRCNLDTIMRHRWLRPYAHYFDRTVDQLEDLAHEQMVAKRAAHKRQQAALEAERVAAAPALARSQSTRPDGSVVPSSSSSSAAARSARHQSALGVPGVEPPAGDVDFFAASSRGGRQVTSAIVAPTRTHTAADLFAPNQMPPVPAASAQRPQEKKEKRERSSKKRDGSSGAASGSGSHAKRSAQRHTIQVEYEQPAEEVEPLQVAMEGVQEEPSQAPVQTSPTAMDVDLPPVLVAPSASPSPAPEPPSEASSAHEPLPTTPPSADAPEPAPRPSTPPPPSSVLAPAPADEPAPSTTAGEAAPVVVAPTDEPNRNSVVFPPSPAKSPNGTSGTTPGSPTKPAAPLPTTAAPAATPPPTPPKSNRHKKGLSMDRFSLGKLISGSSASAEEKEKRPGSSGAGKGTHPPMAGVTRYGGKHHGQGQDDETTSIASKRSSKQSGESKRRKALSLMVEPFGRGSATRDRSKAVAQAVAAAKEDIPPSSSSPAVGRPELRGRRASAAVVPSVAAAEVPKPPATAREASFQKQLASLPHAQPYGNGTYKGSSSRAKTVMNWFRSKGLAKAGLATPPTTHTLPDAFTPPTSSTPTHTAAPPAYAAEPAPAGANTDTPQVVVTSPPPAAANGKVPTAAAARPAILEAAMEVHKGALDQNALTTKAPPVVMDEVRHVVLAMGMIIRKDGDVYLKCVRPNRTGTLSGRSVGLGLSGAGFNTVGSAGSSNTLDRRGLPTSSSFAGQGAGAGQGQGGMLSSASVAGGLKNLLFRRSSQSPSTPTHSHHQPGASSPSASIITLDNSPDQPGSPGESSLGHGAGGASSPNVKTAALPATVYGEPNDDSGGEVVIEIRLTKIKNLPGLYSVDLKRMTGNLRDYRFLYMEIIQRCAFAESR